MRRVWQDHRELELSLGASISVHCLSSWGCRISPKVIFCCRCIARNSAKNHTQPEHAIPVGVVGNSHASGRLDFRGVPTVAALPHLLGFDVNNIYRLSGFVGHLQGPFLTGPKTAV
jgi:hypothetical protein